MLKNVLITTLFFLLGCGVAEKKPPIVVKEVPTFKLMYVKIDKDSFIKSEQVKVFTITDGIADTSKGQISILDLEDTRSEFRLFINTPNGEKVRVLNIKPKYKDGIWLQEGKYHIEVSAKKHQTYKKWIQLNKDTSLTIKLKRQKNISVGTVSWSSKSGVKYIDGLYWQDQAVNKVNKMNWDKANKYCKALIIKSGRVYIDDFKLPSESELISLYKSNSRLDYSGSICWSSSINEKHTDFAKYVFINNKKSGWYKKSGSSYVRCVAHRNYSEQLSLLELAKLLQKEKKRSFLDALESSIKIKYGEPVVKNVFYDSRKKSLSFTLRSQKYDSNKKYFYNKKHTVPMKYHPKSLHFKPKVTFDVINDKLVFKSITNH